MNYGPEYVAQVSAMAAARRLQQAATFARLAIKQPMFQRRMGKGSAAVLVRLEWPGVLSVYDPETGAALAISEPGRPDVLRTGFVPPLPAQISDTLGRTVQGSAR